MKKFHSTAKKVKKLFPSHQWIRVKVKKNPTNPFNSMVFGKIIKDSKDLNHTQYAIYVHDLYLCIRSLQFDSFEPIRLILDSKLWVEIDSVFKLDDISDNNIIFARLKHEKDELL